MKRVAILTRDGAGVNACIRSVTRALIAKGIEPIGVMRGYDGLIDNDLTVFTRRSVSNIIGLGGTILKTSRALRFKTEDGQRKALETIKKNDIDGLIIIGGNGSLTGAHVLAEKYNITVIGIPATIDNDINGIDGTIGSDTAINVAMDAVDKIRDTASSLERIFVVEVMGRDCGYIASQVAIAGGCEDFNITTLCEEISWGNCQGKLSWIIITAEGKAKAADIAKQINQITGLETRELVLGHIQRGGAPTAKDRILAARLGIAAVDAIVAGKSDICVGIKDDIIIEVPLAIATMPKKWDVELYYKISKMLN
jgi:6-phosphofructokinase 1